MQFKCPDEDCGRFFSDKGNLIIHLRIHNEIKPYRCDICSKEFRILGNYNDHKRRHLK
jgi:KRAB domain-containing zinc finger protein